MTVKGLMEKSVQVLCPVFGRCGGCRYQDRPYEEELLLKQEQLKELFIEPLKLSAAVFVPIIPSPKPAHYRHRLDLKLLKTKSQEIFIGFSPENVNRIVPIEECLIAREEICAFLPQLLKEVIAKLPSRYRLANLVVKTGDDGRVLWGGIGRHSLKLNEEDYLWTEIHGKKFFYSLDNFFQANLSILPRLIEEVRGLEVWGRETILWDLYSGVGLFGICLADLVKEVYLVEESQAASTVAEFNVRFHQLNNVKVRKGKVEDEWENLLIASQTQPTVAIIDPPRDGLSPKVQQILSQAQELRSLLYLSCHPESLVRDIKVLTKARWSVEKVIPFDFFPRTKHIETLVLLEGR